MTITIITGASRGIGKAIAEDLKSNDSILFPLCSKDVDFQNYIDVFAYVSSLLEKIEDITRINIVLCAAQIGTYKSIDPREFDKLFKINVLGNYAVIEACSIYDAPLRVVWFAGGGAAFPYPEFFGYSLSKVAVVRAVENLSTMLHEGSSIIALAPGAVETDMLKKVIESGAEIRTRTGISEPVNFVRKFITDEFNSIAMNGRFFHVRDQISGQYILDHPNLFKLRRIE